MTAPGSDTPEEVSMAIEDVDTAPGPQPNGSLEVQANGSSGPDGTLVEEAVGADERRAKMERLRGEGVEPYPHLDTRVPRTWIADLQPKSDVEHQPDQFALGLAFQLGDRRIQLGPQAVHIDVERVALHVGRGSPGRVDQVISRRDQAVAAHQEVEQVELLAGEMNRPAIARHLAAAAVECQVSCPQ